MSAWEGLSTAPLVVATQSPNRAMGAFVSTSHAENTQSLLREGTHRNGGIGDFSHEGRRGGAYGAVYTG